ncbi:MAG TPA: LamG-like jellyroll fold domain-containing protein, partial [Polyangiaceae bacterium]
MPMTRGLPLGVSLTILILCLSALGCSQRPTEATAKRSERLVVTNGLVAAYDFEEGTGSTAADVSGTGNTGTLSGATWSTAGRRGKALSFDGTDDRVVIPDSSSLDLTSGMTVMAWAKPASTASDWQTLVIKELDSEELAYALYAADGSGAVNAHVRADNFSEGVFGDHHPLRTDRWTHVAATYDGSAFSLYVNGRLNNSVDVSGAIATSSDPLSVGGNSIWGEWFNGLIDEVRVYDRGLSSSEVALEMDGISPGPAPALVAAYAFDEGAGASTGDASGRSNTGTISGATWSTSGKHGGALSFDGVDDRVVVADSASLDVTYGMTLMAWVKPSAINDWSTVLMKELDTSDLAYALYAGGNGLLPSGYVNHDGELASASGPTELPLDAWSHIAVTHDDISLSLYVNGTLASSVDYDGDVGATNGALSIGGNAIWGEWFEGLIDDVRIYDNGLTAAQIATDMNTPVGGGTGCGSGCDDGNACNGVETCVNNACVAGTPVTCTASDQCHDAGTCNPSTGLCSNPPKTNGTSCNDTNACTQTDTCQSGTCTGANPVVCTAQDSCHDAGTCNTSTGVCSNPAKANGTACNDATVCNGAETCQSGTCSAGTPPTVNDGNPCTTDACDPIAGVTHTPVTAGTLCLDANVCNGSESCNSTGTCIAGTPPTVNDGNPCTTDSCDQTTGISHTPVAVGTSCSDSDLCNGTETCDAAGACTPGTPVATDDGNPCTTDTCDPANGVTHTPVAAGTPCPDGNVCNGLEACSASGACAPGIPLNLDDENSCTSDSCDPVAGVHHEPVANGTPCPDSTVCNGNEACNAGACSPGTPLVTDDGNQCTVDSCDPINGVAHTLLAGCDQMPPVVGDRLETRASLIGRVEDDLGGPINDFTVEVFDALPLEPHDEDPRDDAVTSSAADGSFRTRLTAFPQVPTPGSPLHRVLVFVEGPDFVRMSREAYLRPGDVVDLGTMVVLRRDPVVTIIDSSGGVATDSQNLVELNFPPGAVLGNVPVRITPIINRDQFPHRLPDATATMYGVVFEPDGTEFMVPVTVRLANYRNVPTNLQIPHGVADETTGR